MRFLNVQYGRHDAGMYSGVGYHCIQLVSKKTGAIKFSTLIFVTTACFDKNILLSAYTETAILKLNVRQEVEVNYM